MNIKVLLCILAFCITAATQAQEALLPKVAQDTQAEMGGLWLGVFNYYYLTEDYQSALNVLAQQREQNSSTTLDVLQATLYLALGLNTQAQELFNTINQKDASVPAQAWFYLAKRYHALGDEGALAMTIANALNARVSPLNDEQWQEALYLSVSSLVAHNRFANAKAAYILMAPNTLWKGLALHNLLVFKVESYAAIADIKQLMAEIPYAVPNDEQGLLLTDRMNLLGGIYMLRTARYQEAEKYLAQVRQDSPYAAPAMLQYGWALLEQSRYHEALQPWRVILKNYQSWHPASVEALVAVPHTLELMNVTTQALYSYQNVEQKVQQMLGDIARLENPKEQRLWLANWLAQQQGDWGWRRQNTHTEAPDFMSQALLPLLSQTAFQTQLAEYYDSKRMAENLTKQQRQLELWAQAVQGRHAHFERMQGQERLKKLKAKQAALLAKVSVLEALWLEEQQSVFAFASARQKAQLVHLERVVPLVKGLQQVNTPTRNLNQYKERWRRSRGVLLWQMYKQEPARSFFADQNFFELAQTLDSLHEQLAHSETALAWAAMGYQGLEARITHELSRVQALQAQVKETQQSQEEALLVQMTDTLNTQKNQLLGYQAQARLALARLYDDALQTQLAASKGGEQ